jgi:hypothetical protein
MFKRGDIVYCEYNKQVYVILDTSDKIAYVRNLTNLDSKDDYKISIDKLIEYPNEWRKNDLYEFYKKLVKAILK